MFEKEFDAVLDNIPAVTDFVDEALEIFGCPMKTQIQIDVAIDELFSNIARYAYAPGTGRATVRVEELENPHGMSLTFEDNGIPYDPLAKEDPDISLSLEERGIGGLGIFMVKKTMDDMIYTYQNDKNILQIRKYF